MHLIGHKGELEPRRGNTVSDLVAIAFPAEAKARASGCSFGALMNTKKDVERSAGTLGRPLSLHSRALLPMQARWDKYRFGPTGVRVGGHRELSLPQGKLSPHRQKSGSNVG